MAVTPTTLTRAAAAAAVAAGVIFIGVQINHPHLDATSITTTEMAVRNSLKTLMAVLALAGITGMYLSQARRNGILGLAGYLVFGAGYLVIASTSIFTAYALPSLAASNTAYVGDVIAASLGRTPAGDIGALQTVFQVQSAAYLVGGLVFGVALYRARVLARWATVLLAVSGAVSAVLSFMPDAFYRLLAFPNGIAMIALGYSLWRVARRSSTTDPAEVAGRPVTTATAQ